jgi:hypothetical protein
MARTASERMGPTRKLQPMRRILGRTDGANRVDDITKGKAPAIGEVVCDLVGAGLGVIFAPTRDGGAISVTILDGEDREKGYAGDSEQFDSILTALGDLATARRLAGSDG